VVTGAELGQFGFAANQFPREDVLDLRQVTLIELRALCTVKV